MLHKNRISALFLSFILFTGLIGGYLPLMLPKLSELPPLPVKTLLGGIAILLLLVFLISRSPMVMGLEEAEGFGWRGLLRWLFCGLLSGYVLSLGSLAPQVSKSRYLIPILEIVASAVAIYVPYWLIFRRDLSKMFDSPWPTPNVNPSCLFWAMIIGGGLAAAGCALVAVTSAGRNPGLFWMALGGFCISSGAPLLGLLGRGSLRPRSAMIVLPLVGLGLVLFLVGMFRI